MYRRGGTVAHLAKYKSGQASAISRHWKRENKNYSNENIRQEFSYLNYNLAPERNSEWLKQKVEEHKNIYASSKNLNVLCDWVVTAPIELTEPEQQKRFFEETYQFLKERYNHADNIYSACVHMDETTPHLHFAFIPITEKGNISAKEVVDRKDLRTFHDDFQQYLDVHLEYPCKVVKHDNISRSKSLNDYKKEKSMLKELNTIHVTEEQKSKFGNSYKITAEQKEKIDLVDELLPKLILLFEQIQKDIKEKQKSIEQTKKQSELFKSMQRVLLKTDEEINAQIDKTVQNRTESLTQLIKDLSEELNAEKKTNQTLQSIIEKGEKPYRYELKQVNKDLTKAQNLIKKFDEYLTIKGLRHEFVKFKNQKNMKLKRGQEYEHER